MCWLTSADQIEINGTDTIFTHRDKSHTGLIAKAAGVFIYDGAEMLSALKHVKVQLLQYKTGLIAHRLCHNTCMFSMITQ